MEVDETGDPVPSLDRIQFRIANRDQANTEEDLLLTVAALSIGEAFSEEQACIDVLYDHVASTLGIDSAEAMHKVDARARDIDQISERPHLSLTGLTVDPVEYLPESRFYVNLLKTEICVNRFFLRKYLRKFAGYLNFLGVTYINLGDT